MPMNTASCGLSVHSKMPHFSGYVSTGDALSFLRGRFDTFQPLSPQAIVALDDFYDFELIRYDFRRAFTCLTHALFSPYMNAYMRTQIHTHWIHARVCTYTHACTCSHVRATRNVYVHAYTMHTCVRHTRTLHALNVHA